MGRGGSGAISASLDYVSRDKALLKDKDGKPIVFTHNLLGGQSLAEVKKQFEELEARRVYRRSNNNQVLHHVLAFKPETTEHLDVAKLERLTREFFNLYDADRLYYSVVHTDKEHIHVHIIASGVNIAGLSNSLSKQEYQHVKEQMQEIQKEYPELNSSLVNFDKHERSIEPDYWAKQGKSSEKEDLKERLASAYAIAQSRAEFLELLKEDDIAVYERGGKITGVETDTRHFRFSNLNIDFEELDQREMRLQELETNGAEEIEQEQIPQQQEMTEEETRLKELDDLAI